MNPELAHAIAGLLGWLPLFLFIGGGGMITTLLLQRHERNMLREKRALEEQNHRQMMERLTIQKELAIATGEAISILMVDKELAGDFDARLKVAIAQAETVERTGVRINASVASIGERGEGPDASGVLAEQEVSVPPAQRRPRKARMGK